MGAFSNEEISFNEKLRRFSWKLLKDGGLCVVPMQTQYLPYHKTIMYNYINILNLHRKRSLLHIIYLPI